MNKPNEITMDNVEAVLSTVKRGSVEIHKDGNKIKRIVEVRHWLPEDFEVTSK